MSAIIRWGLTAICLFAAIGCYVFGAPAGGMLFLLLGAVFEGLFWFRIFGKKSK